MTDIRTDSWQEFSSAVAAASKAGKSVHIDLGEAAGADFLARVEDVPPPPPPD